MLFAGPIRGFQASWPFDYCVDFQTGGWVEAGFWGGASQGGCGISCSVGCLWCSLGKDENFDFNGNFEKNCDFNKI